MYTIQDIILKESLLDVNLDLFINLEKHCSPPGILYWETGNEAMTPLYHILTINLRGTWWKTRTGGFNSSMPTGTCGLKKQDECRDDHPEHPSNTQLGHKGVHWFTDYNNISGSMASNNFQLECFTIISSHIMFWGHKLLH